MPTPVSVLKSSQLCVGFFCQEKVLVNQSDWKGNVAAKMQPSATMLSSQQVSIKIMLLKAA